MSFCGEAELAFCVNAECGAEINASPTMNEKM